MNSPAAGKIRGQTKAGGRGLARLAAVQALYQCETTGQTPAAVIAEFRVHRLGAEIDGTRYGEADAVFFADLVEKTLARCDDIDPRIEEALSGGWTVARLETILRAILRLGTAELLYVPEVPAKVVIDEYVDLAHAFFDGGEPGLVNGVLDRLAREIRNDLGRLGDGS